MKHILPFFFAWLMVAGLPLFARNVNITIVHTTDLHGTLLPTTNYDGQPDTGGLLRCATAIKKIRQETPNVLLLDAGDLFQGAPVSFLTQGSVMTRVVNQLQYNGWALGNHEFDWGMEQLAARLTETQCPVLAANLHYLPPNTASTGMIRAFAKVQPYIIRQVDGVNIGIIGLTTPGVPNWSRPHLISGLTFEDSVSALRKTVPKVKAAGAQVLVLLAHQGYRERGDDHASQLKSIAVAFPELAVIIGGHSHRFFTEQPLNQSLYTQAGYWGGALGRVDLTYDNASKRLISRRSTLVAMDSTVPVDASLLASVKPDLDRTETFLSQKIGETSVPLETPNKSKYESTLFNLLAESIASGLQQKGGRVDGVFHGILRENIAISPGPIRMRDVFQLVPYENTLGILQLNTSQIRELLENNAKLYASGQFRGFWGFLTRLKPSASIGHRVIFLGDPDGKPLDPNRRYGIAFNSFDLASAGLRFEIVRHLANLPECQIVEYDLQTRDAVASYIQQHSPLQITTHGWWQTERKPQARKTSRSP
ncbi:MAG: bifunctional UDP-sugar hydrolase/5'-nucleotidase [Verrucomicrobiae bacterium]|nr:bifunctional UDP-sugar hydrolase/5'-nucleotidase [Verrucomicrobiae bacterium]